MDLAREIVHDEKTRKNVLLDLSPPNECNFCMIKTPLTLVRKSY
jgi:hypothetical protein